MLPAPLLVSEMLKIASALRTGMAQFEGGNNNAFFPAPSMPQGWMQDLDAFIQKRRPYEMKAAMPWMSGLASPATTPGSIGKILEGVGKVEKDFQPELNALHLRYGHRLSPRP